MKATLAVNELGGHAFMTSTLKGVCVWGGEALRFVTCLRILLFLDYRSIVHFCRWAVGSQNCSFFVDFINI